MPSSTASEDPAFLVRAQDLGVRRGGRWLIHGVCLSVAPGEIVSLIGPNGSGKTTTARTLVGALQPDQGRVQRKPGLTVGYVPQRLTVDPVLPFTVARLMTLTGPYPRETVARALAEVGASHLETAQVRHLSGGEFQRVALARALVRQPDLLVLDEPVQGVDFAGEVALYELIQTIRERYGCGVLLISHDLHIVMAQTDTVVCLNQHVCCSGSPRSVAASSAYRELFGARAAAALAVYRHHHDHVHAGQDRILPLTPDRPEDDREVLGDAG